MNVAADLFRPAHSSTYEVAGRFLFLEVDDATTASAVERFLSRWHLKAIDTPLDTADARIVIHVKKSPPPKPRGGEIFSLPDNAVGFSFPTGYRIEFGSGVLSASGRHQEIMVWLDSPLKFESSLLAPVISHALSAALRRCDIFELHSAAVVNSERGHSVLICGPSGSGKSTLTLHLVATGWKYVSDDVLLLSRELEKVKATGLRRFFALTRETIELSNMPDVRALLSASDSGSPKLSLVPESVLPTSPVNATFPNAILFTNVKREGRTEIAPLSNSEAMAKLIRLCPWSCYDHVAARSFLGLLASLVKQSRSFALSASADLIADPSVTTNLITATLEEKAR